MRFSSAETAFYEITERAGGVWLRRATLLAVVIASGIANAMAAQAAVSRILFAMARDGRLPAQLARVHSRYRTPYVSALAVALVSLAVGLSFAKRLDDLSRIVNFGALTAFLLLHLAVINHYLFRHHSRDWVRHLLFPLLGFTVVAYVLVEMDKAAKLMGAGWLALGIVYYVIVCRVLKKPVVLKI